MLAPALVISCITLQVRANNTAADVRHVMFLVLLGGGLGCSIAARAYGLALAVSLNVPHGGMHLNWCGVRSTSHCFVRELLYPFRGEMMPGYLIDFDQQAGQLRNETSIP